MKNTQGIPKFDAMLVELWKTSRGRERERERERVYVLAIGMLDVQQNKDCILG